MSRHILMIVTSTDRMPSGKPTGLWLEEFAVPYLVFKKAGYEITVASPKGGNTPIDPRSSEDAKSHPDWAAASEVLKTTQKLDDSFRAKDFDALFFPGGHGPVFDLPGNALTGKLLLEFDAAGKVLAAVCHGPVGFIGPVRPDGKPLVAGRRMTAFSDNEERTVGLDKDVPFLLESKLRELGAQVQTAANFTAHAIRDGKFITGQNPTSSKRIAELVVEALS